MHPQVVWLFKKLRKMDNLRLKKGLRTNDVESFCKVINKKRYAICMLAALFEITESGTHIGKIVREIDQIAISHTQSYPAMKRYDLLLVHALDDSIENPLYEICKKYKHQYKGKLPDLHKTDFSKLEEQVKEINKPRLFNPANLF